jgi:Tol biopolymer transport system component/DNA-binding winged helix-turn-helix (wHTH) protein
MMDDSQWIRYQFGRYTLETGRDQLLMDGVVVHLQRKSFEILRLLLENAGTLVHKETIQSLIWPDRQIDDTNLSQHVYTLRRILDDNPKVPTFILTIPGKGYIFKHPVRFTYLDPTSISDLEEPPAPPASPLPLSSEEVLSKEIAQRAAERVESIPEAPPTPPTREGGRRGSRWVRNFVIGMSLVLAGFLGYGLLLRQLNSPVGKEQPPRTRILTSLPGLENRPRFSPDGNLIVFSNTGYGLGIEHIYIKQVRQGDSLQLTFGEYQDRYPTWSPDGQQIAFLRHRPGHRKLQLIVIPALGGPERLVAEVAGGLDWAPDGKHLVVLDSSSPGATSSFNLLSVDGKDQRPLEIPSTSANTFDELPRFSPDGRSLAFVRWFSDVASDLYVFSMTDRSLQRLTFDQRQISSLAWSANGQEILFISRRSGNPVPWQISSSGGRPTVNERIPTGTLHFDIAHTSGRLVFTSIFSDSLVRIASLEGKPWKRDRVSVLPVHCSINSSRGDHSPRLSADGSKVAYISDQTGWEEIWKANSDGSKPVQLTSFEELGVGSPRWSPDGQWIVFDRRTNRQSDIYVIKEDGSGLQQLTFHQLPDTMPSWSPDGKWIYFTSFQGGKSQIWKVGRAGGDPLQVTQAEANESMASSDGQHLYFTSLNKKLLRLNLSTGKEEVVTGLEQVEIGRFWALTPNGIYFVSDRDKNIRRDDPQPVICRYDLNSRKISPITLIEGILPEWLPGLSVTSDERMIAYSYLTTLGGDIQLIENWK